MKHAKWLVFLLSSGLLAFTACQPQEIQVEVTRLVEVPAEVEVTRLVTDTERGVEVATSVVVQEVPELLATVEVTPPPLGSSERPVQLLFPPVADTEVATRRGQFLADALAAATDREFAVGVLDSEQAVLDLLCAAPADTIAFLSASAYVVANAACAAQPAAVAVHDDAYSWQTGMLISRRDSGINELGDLAGRSWAVADTSSVPDYLYLRALLAQEGIEPGEIIELPSESATILAVYNGEADFATAAYTPPVMPFEERLWVYGEDDPEPSRYLGIPATRSPIGYVVVAGDPENGGYRLRDARARIFDVQPDIYDRTQIVTLGAQIPNETLTFGSDFPLALARQVSETVVAFMNSEACAASLCADDFYGWLGMQPTTDEAYAPLRAMAGALELTAEEMLTPGG